MKLSKEEMRRRRFVREYRWAIGLPCFVAWGGAVVSATIVRINHWRRSSDIRRSYSRRQLAHGRSPLRRDWYGVFVRDASGLQHWHSAAYVFADSAGRVSLSTFRGALASPWRETDPGGRWFVNAEGALERPLTVHEAHHGGAPAYAFFGGVCKWRVVSPDEIQGILTARRMTPGPNPVSELETIEARNRLEDRRYDAAESVAQAREAVRTWQRKQRLATTKLAQWKRKLVAREARLSRLEPSEPE